MSETAMLIFNTVFSIVVLGVMIYGCWISSVMISERNKLRKITGKYYEYEIEEELKKQGLTKEEVLKKGEM